jgi:ABC-type dipeptide/oligopeptide/nickel transport system permease component
MTLARYAIRRALGAALLVYVVAVAAFVLTRLAPGDFVDVAQFDQDARVRAAARQRLGLDRPLPAQIVDVAIGALRLDFGPSLLYEGRAVTPIVAERARNTFLLGVAALLLATAIGLPLGRFTGTRTGPRARLARGGSLLVLSVPPLLAALLLAVVAARTRLLPSGGMTSAQTLTGTAWWLDVARHLILPASALALPLAATLERLQAAAIADAVRLPFVGASRARGLDEGAAIRVHAWPVSLVPVLGVYGVIIGSVLSGAFAVEVVMQWPGLGRLLVDAMTHRDAGLVAGCAAAAAAGLALGTLVADVALAVLDPRVRLGEGGA